MGARGERADRSGGVDPPANIVQIPTKGRYIFYGSRFVRQRLPSSINVMDKPSAFRTLQRPRSSVNASQPRRLSQTDNILQANWKVETSRRRTRSFEFIARLKSTKLVATQFSWYVVRSAVAGARIQDGAFKIRRATYYDDDFEKLLGCVSNKFNWIRPRIEGTGVGIERERSPPRNFDTRCIFEIQKWYESAAMARENLRYFVKYRRSGARTEHQFLNFQSYLCNLCFRRFILPTDNGEIFNFAPWTAAVRNADFSPVKATVYFVIL